MKKALLTVLIAVTLLLTGAGIASASPWITNRLYNDSYSDRALSYRTSSVSTATYSLGIGGSVAAPYAFRLPANCRGRVWNPTSAGGWREVSNIPASSSPGWKSFASYGGGRSVKITVSC